MLCLTRRHTSQNGSSLDSKCRNGGFSGTGFAGKREKRSGKNEKRSDVGMIVVPHNQSGLLVCEEVLMSEPTPARICMDRLQSSAKPSRHSIMKDTMVHYGPHHHFQPIK